ncbi:hypothetical protein [Streptomyces sp. NPDC048277]|uniref:hypothetical protein n=1 Tax=Streptomyces sp. NPDC048277 TaxID=3155027 RepID=UPI0033CFAB7A
MKSLNLAAVAALAAVALGSVAPYAPMGSAIMATVSGSGVTTDDTGWGGRVIAGSTTNGDTGWGGRVIAIDSADI